VFEGSHVRTDLSSQALKTRYKIQV
jgi:hypothetical protein